MKLYFGFLIGAGLALAQTQSGGFGQYPPPSGGSSSVGNCQSASSTPGNCYPAANTVVFTNTNATATYTASSATLDIINLGTLGANITSFVINSATNGQQFEIIACEPASGGPYTIASPTGFPTVTAGNYPSRCVDQFYTYINSSNIIAGAVKVSSGPGECPAQTIAASNPPSGVYYDGCTSTQPFYSLDSSGNTWNVVKGVSAPVAGTYVSYIDTGGVQHTSTVTKPVFKFGAAFGAPSSGTALTTTMVGYSTPAPAACTIQNWSLMVDSGTATIQFMKVASGTALPTHASNNISTAGVSIASGTVVDRSAILTDFTTTAVAQGDIIGVYLTTLSGPDYLAVEVECQ